MNNAVHKTLVGIQGSVMGWDDPWHYRLCSTYMRTGERKHFPSQDLKPQVDEFLKLIREIGVDFYLHQVMPEEDEINSFIESISKYGMPYYLGNEYGNINKLGDGICNRYDIPEACVEKAKASGNFLGLFYDETEHLQLHPDIYADNQPEEYKNLEPGHQWTPTEGRSLDEIERNLVEAVKKRISVYGQDVACFSEQVFPVMYHSLARGGMNPCPKLLKEEFQSLQLATALGAAKQYKKNLGICVDLWGPDVGNWFTRLWGFPGHSPVDFKSGLEIAYLMGPKILFAENIDPLAVYSEGGFEKTEFGDIFEEFIKKFIPENPRLYDHTMLEPEIVIIRSDDTDWSIAGGFGGRGLYGSKSLHGDYKTQSVFKIFNLLSHGRIPESGISFWIPDYSFPTSKYSRTNDNVKLLPLKNGVHDCNEYVHKLFYPMNNVAVFDERVNSQSLGNPKLIILAGSRITEETFKVISDKVRGGSVCIAAEWLIPVGMKVSGTDGLGEWFVVNDFSDPALADFLKPFLGDRDCWMQRFGNYELRFFNQSGDGVTLTHEITRIER